MRSSLAAVALSSWIFSLGSAGCSPQPRVYRAAQAPDAADDEPAPEQVRRDAGVRRNDAAPVQPRPADAAPLPPTEPPPAEPPPDAGALPPPDARPPASSQPIPAPWKSEDIGTVATPGNSSQGRGRYEVAGAGADVWGTQDAFHFVHRPISGDHELLARLVSQDATVSDAKAGLMLRESNAPDARNVFMAVFPSVTDVNGDVKGKGTRLQYRDKRTDLLTGYLDIASISAAEPDAAPLWLKIVRKGALFTGYLSGDGSTWIKDGEATIPTLPMNLLAGLAVTSHAAAETSVAVFEGLRISALRDDEWKHDVVGTLGSYAGGGPSRFELESAGAGLVNKADAVTFVHRTQQHIGDLEITGRVTALTYDGNSAARVGFMLRSGLEPGARMLSFVLERSARGETYTLVRRNQDDGNVTVTGGAKPTGGGGADAGPRPLRQAWLRLVRVGNQFVGLVNDDRDSRGPWVPVVSLPAFVISSNAYVGVFAASGTDGAVSAATIEDLTISVPGPGAVPSYDAGAPDAGP
jgi:hypothetical protein